MQAIGSVIETGNDMFDRSWKFHSEEAIIDLDTVPIQVNKSILPHF